MVTQQTCNPAIQEADGKASLGNTETLRGKVLAVQASWT